MRKLPQKIRQRHLLPELYYRSKLSEPPKLSILPELPELSMLAELPTPVGYLSPALPTPVGYLSPALPTNSQAANAPAAATFRESIPWHIGIITL